MQKHFLFILLPIFVYLQHPVFSQEIPTKQVPEIIVETSKKFFLDDHTSRTIQIKPGISMQQRHVGDLLKLNSSAVIRNYGAPGSLTSISMRGTGSNHTQVTWNGIPLNSPTSGQADLSLIPTGMIQTIEVVNGASGSLFGSGTFGGSVNLGNEPDWNNRFSADYALHSGSFGSWGHKVTLKAGTGRFQYQAAAITNSAANDFTYLDRYLPDSPKVRNQHNVYRDFGLLQNFFLDLNKNRLLEAGIWYQKKSLEIPSLMGSYKPVYAVQSDSLFRTYISYRKKGRRSALLIRSAYVTDYLNYRDKMHADSSWALDSRIQANQLLNEADYRLFLSPKVIAGAGAAYNHLYGHSNNYRNSVRENEFIFYGSLKVVLKNMIITTGLRKEFYEGLNPDPQYSAGIRYKLMDRLVLRSSFSTRFRKPTFNEKYWKPGGNPDLKPEKGRGGEFTVEWKTKANQAYRLETNITGFYQTVDNWIQWIMLDSLTPAEYKKVNSRGIEAWLEYGINKGPFTVSGNFNYTYNRSTIAGTFDDNKSYEGNQLIYIPEHTITSSSDITCKGYMLGLSIVYAGSRETVETGDKAFRLPPYTLVNMSAGLMKKIGNVPLSAYFQIQNLTNKSYQAVRSYAMPGRSFHLTLMVGFVKNNIKNPS